MSDKVKLPTGLTEFEELITSLQTEFDLPTKIRDDVRFVVATNILNSPEGTDAIAKEHFVKLIHAAAAKQVAAEVFHDIKLKQKEAEQKRREEAALALEATKKVVESSDPAQG